MGIADLQGRLKTTANANADIKDRDFFKLAASGNEVVAVLIATRDENDLSQIINDIKFGESGNAFMINKKGTMTAHSDINLVIDMYNAIEEAKNDQKLTSLAELQKLMIEGKTGVGACEFNGEVKYMGYTPVEGTNWSLAITASKSEV